MTAFKSINFKRSQIRNPYQKKPPTGTQINRSSQNVNKTIGASSSKSGHTAFSQSITPSRNISSKVVSPSPPKKGNAEPALMNITKPQFQNKNKYPIKQKSKILPKQKKKRTPSAKNILKKQIDLLKKKADARKLLIQAKKEKKDDTGPKKQIMTNIAKQSHLKAKKDPTYKSIKNEHNEKAKGVAPIRAERESEKSTSDKSPFLASSDNQIKNNNKSDHHVNNEKPNSANSIFQTRTQSSITCAVNHVEVLTDGQRDSTTNYPRNQTISLSNLSQAKASKTIEKPITAPSAFIPENTNSLMHTYERHGKKVLMAMQHKSSSMAQVKDILAVPSLPPSTLISQTSFKEVSNECIKSVGIELDEKSMKGKKLLGVEANLTNTLDCVTKVNNNLMIKEPYYLKVMQHESPPACNVHDHIKNGRNQRKFEACNTSPALNISMTSYQSNGVSGIPSNNSSLTKQTVPRLHPDPLFPSQKNYEAPEKINANPPIKMVSSTFITTNNVQPTIPIINRLPVQQNPIANIVNGSQTNKGSSEVLQIISHSTHPNEFEKKRRNAARAFALGIDSTAGKDSQTAFGDKKIIKPGTSVLSNVDASDGSISTYNAFQAKNHFKSDEEKKKEARAYALGNVLERKKTDVKVKQQSSNVQSINYPNDSTNNPNNTACAVNKINPEYVKKQETRSYNQSQEVLTKVEGININQPSTSIQSSTCQNVDPISKWSGLHVPNCTTSEEERKKKARAYALGCNPKPKKTTKAYKRNKAKQSSPAHHNWSYSYSSPYPFYNPNPYNYFFPFLNPPSPYPWAPHPHVNMPYSATPLNYFNQFPMSPLLQQNYAIPTQSIYPIQKRLQLTKCPMELPSPWAKTHAAYEKIVHIKKPIEGSFGVSVEYKTRTALVPRKRPSNTIETQGTRKPRRKRTPFGVVLVTQIKQQEYSSEVEDDSRIKVDDIILSIQGVSVGEKEFSEACKLFAAPSIPIKDDKWKVCAIKVARPKQKSSNRVKKEKKEKNNTFPALPKQITVPIVVNQDTNTIISGDFSIEETNALISGMQRAHATKLIRKSQFDYEDIWDVVKTLHICKNVFTKRTNSDLMKKWNFETSLFDKITKENAKKYWEESWGLETAKDSNLGSNFECLTDSQRSQLRLSHRPPRGCKCGSLDHDRVNHPQCILYRNLKQQVIGEIGKKYFEEAISNQDPSTDAQKNSTKDTGKSELILQRIRDAKTKRMKLNHEADEKEAFYVEYMEKVQVKNGMAIFAPTHLSIMVISAVTELSKLILQSKSDDQNMQDITPKKEANSPKQKPLSIENIDDLSDSDSDNDDDDILLVSLKSKETKEQKEEIQKVLDVVNASFKEVKTEKTTVTMLDVLMYISKTWGHVFEEPSHLEYSW